MTALEQNELKFKKFLIGKGYKQTTPSGNPSTVYDYLKRIHKISEAYNFNIYEIEDIAKLEKIKRELDKDGINQDLGNRSHRAVYNAMARYCEFIKDS